MKIWIANITEPLPMEKNSTPDRLGILAKNLAERGHEVIWWASNFSVTKKKFIYANGREEQHDGITFRILNSRGFKKERSIGEWLHYRRFAERFYLFARQASRPDFVITSVPNLDLAEVIVQYARDWKIPMLVDVRDRWPFTRIETTPSMFRRFIKFGLKSYTRKYAFICETSTCLISASGELLQFALQKAGREQRSTDGIFDASQEGLIALIQSVSEGRPDLTPKRTAQQNELTI